MKTLTYIILAGAIAATTIAATATGASAGNWNGNGGSWNDDWHGPYKHKPHVVYHQSSPDMGSALFAGALFGLAIGAIASQPEPYYVEPEPYYVEPEREPETVYLPPPHPAYTPPRANLVAADDHYAWCKTNYRSYNAERDTFTDFQGVERRCVTPYE